MRVLVVLLLAGCVGTAPAQPIDHRRCDQSSDCVVFPRTCCGTCGAATREDAVALNRELVAERGRPGCRGQGCPRCTQQPDPALAATCRAHRCEVVDLGARRYTRCGADEECRVRAGTCCECGADPASFIAIRVDTTMPVERILCGGGITCPACVPDYTARAARCVDGRCAVTAIEEGAPVP